MFNNTNGSMNSADYDAQVSMIVSNTLKKEFDKLLADIKKQIPAQTQAIKNEVFTDYTTIVKSVFKSVFYNHYGLKYNEEAMLESIDFHYGTGMLPYFTIDTSKFQWAPAAMREAKKFNANESGYTPYAGIRKKSVEMSISRKIRSFFDNNDGVSVDDYWDDGLNDMVSAFAPQEQNADEIEDDLYQIQINAYNLKRDNNPTETWDNINDVYATAKMRAEQEALRVYNTQIKARIYKKYGLKI